MITSSWAIFPERNLSRFFFQRLAWTFVAKESTGDQLFLVVDWIPFAWHSTGLTQWHFAGEKRFHCRPDWMEVEEFHTPLINVVVYWVSCESHRLSKREHLCLEATRKVHFRCTEWHAHRVRDCTQYGPQPVGSVPLPTRVCGFRQLQVINRSAFSLSVRDSEWWQLRWVLSTKNWIGVGCHDTRWCNRKRNSNSAKTVTFSDSMILTRSFVSIPEAAELVKICNDFACSFSWPDTASKDRGKTFNQCLSTNNSENTSQFSDIGKS